MARSRVLMFGALAVGGMAVLGGPGPQAQAAAVCTATFVPSSGSWTDAANWTPSGVPDSTDYACVPAGTSAAVGAATSAIRGVRIAGTVSVATGRTLTVDDDPNTSPSE